MPTICKHTRMSDNPLTEEQQVSFSLIMQTIGKKGGMQRWKNMSANQKKEALENMKIGKEKKRVEREKSDIDAIDDTNQSV